MPNFSGMWTERQQMQAAGASTWPAVPGAPTIGTATATSGTTASVGFTAPSYTGYPAGITGYTATSSPGGLTGTGASSPITVSGLTTGTAYTFTVTATNATGTGPSSAASNSVTPPFTYIEDVFSTYLYTGNGSARTITNGIDLAGKGGLVWTKTRVDTAGFGGTNIYHHLVNSASGIGNWLVSNTTDAQQSASYINSFNSNGYNIQGGRSEINANTNLYVSWTFAEKAKFFDVVTYTGTGSARTIAHSLGSVPGCIIVKKTSNTDAWLVYHRSNGATGYTLLNTTAAFASNSTVWNNTDPTSTDFTVGTSYSTNQPSETYVAYIFAHDAGGFGASGTDNVITCGSFVGTGSNQTINLGYEPQLILSKRYDGTGSWVITDTMRGQDASYDGNYLYPNLPSVETGLISAGFSLTSTGFITNASANYIYIAIRRGPMKVPTDGTTVFAPVLHPGTGPVELNAGFPPDLAIIGSRDGAAYQQNWLAKLPGSGAPYTASTGAKLLASPSPAAEVANNYFYLGQNGFGVNTSYTTSDVMWSFQRAPSFFDEVCYTGTGTVGQTFTHNLNATPELMIIKRRNGISQWPVYSAALGATTALFLDADYASLGSPYGSYYWNLTAPTSTVFTVDGTGGNTYVNGSGQTYVAHLFATCAGVSKVGSYTGTGTLTTINCGFAGGARFVLIKRTDSTSNWFVWDTARGMVAGTDPSLSLNSTAAESNANSVYTITTGFQLLASPSKDVNTSGGSYIYLAIA